MIISLYMNLPLSIITTLAAGASLAHATTQEHEIPLIYGMDFNNPSTPSDNVADETKDSSPSFTESGTPTLNGEGLSLNAGYYTMGTNLNLTNGVTFVSTITNKAAAWDGLWSVQMDNDRYISLCTNGASGFALRTTTAGAITASDKSHNFTQQINYNSVTSIVTMQYVEGGNIDITLRLYDASNGEFITQASYNNVSESFSGRYSSTVDQIIVGNGASGLAGPGTLDNFGVYNGLVTEDTMDWLALSLSEGKSIAEVQYIPEPSTATLSLLALSGLLARRRRKNG